MLSWMPLACHIHVGFVSPVAVVSGVPGNFSVHVFRLTGQIPQLGYNGLIILNKCFSC